MITESDRKLAEETAAQMADARENLNRWSDSAKPTCATCRFHRQGLFIGPKFELCVHPKRKREQSYCANQRLVSHLDGWCSKEGLWWEAIV